MKSEIKIIEEQINFLTTKLEKIKKNKNLKQKTYDFINSFSEMLINEHKNFSTIRGSLDLKNFLTTQVGICKNEEFVVIFLNNANKVVCKEVLFKGSISNVSIYPRLIVHKALEYKARGVILVHNHPSGNVKPSKLDIELTTAMDKILEHLDITLLDHIIVNDCFELYSLKDNYDF